MSPRPLSTLFPNAKVYSSNTFLAEERPELAARAMGIIALWSVLDGNIVGLLANFLSKDFVQAYAIWDSINNQAGQRRTLNALADSRFASTKSRRKLFHSALDRINVLRKSRHALAHHYWGFCHELPDDICLLNPRHHNERTFALLQSLIDNPGPAPEISTPLQGISEQIMVYDKTDFDNLLADAHRAAAIIDALFAVVSPPSSLDSEDRWDSLRLLLR